MGTNAFHSFVNIIGWKTQVYVMKNMKSYQHGVKKNIPNNCIIRKVLGKFSHFKLISIKLKKKLMKWTRSVYPNDHYR